MTGTARAAVLHLELDLKLARARPASLDARRGISGVGAKKLDVYGADIVGLVAQFC
jgi:ATP-dependent DNA helicase RecQ